MDKSDLLSRTCAYIGLLCSLIAFYFVVSYFDSPPKTAPAYTEITFTLQKDEPEIKQESAQKADITPSATVKNSENKIEAKENTNLAQKVIKEPQKILKTVTKAENKPKAATTVPKRAQAKNTANTPKKHLQSNTSNKISKSANTAAKNNTAAHAAQKLKQQQIKFANLIHSRLQASLIYPKLAIRRNLEGTAIISFSIKKGKIVSYKISKSSGHKILDDAALKLAAKAASLSADPLLDFNLNVPLKYELN